MLTEALGSDRPNYLAARHEQSALDRALAHSRQKLQLPEALIALEQATGLSVQEDD
jgi:hypothetical protein